MFMQVLGRRMFMDRRRYDVLLTGTQIDVRI